MRTLLVVLAMLALATPAAAARIEVTARLHHQNHSQLPPKGRAGDADLSVWNVRDRTGRTIGEMLVDCHWVTAGLRMCVGQLGLPLGALVMIGASPTSIVGQFAVVGGTGLYERASGVLTFNKIGVARYVLSVTYSQP